MATGSVAVAVAELAGEPVAGGAVLPGLVVVQRLALLTPVAHRVVHALADGIDLGATATGMAVAGTSGRGEEAHEKTGSGL